MHVHTYRWLVIGLTIGFVALGCSNVYEEILNPPKKAGGTVKVTIDEGTERAASALGRNKDEPFTVEGQSSLLTFVLTAADDSSGSTAKQKLSGANTSVELLLSATGRNRIEVHADGKGCVSDGKSGHITLSLGDSSKLEGSFELGGTRSDGGAACLIKGSLVDIPVTNE